MTEAVEALKISLRQEAEGIIVCFRIQPEHLPESLLTARINSRFALAMVEITDDEKPKPPEPAAKQKKKQNANVMRAAIACGEEKFQLFLSKRFPVQWKQAFGEGHDKAAKCMRDVLQIGSRKALATDPEALEQFEWLMAEYELWKRAE